MARLPTPGGDNGQWGQLLNDFLSVEHNADGTLKKAGDISAAQATASAAIPASQKGVANGVAALNSSGKVINAAGVQVVSQDDVPSIGTYVAGRSYMTSGYWTNTGAAMAEGDMVGTPFIVTAQQRFDQIETRLFGVSSAGGLMRLGIYADNNEEPGSLIVDAGTVDASLVVGTLLTRPIDVLLSPGIYWVVQVPQGGATTRGAPFGARGAIGETPGIWARRPADANYCYPMRTGVTGVLPAAFERTTEHHTGHRATLRSAGAA